MKSAVGALLEEILDPLSYEKIVLFGSRATGEYSEGSDYDILVILKDNISIRQKMSLSARVGNQE